MSRCFYVSFVLIPLLAGLALMIFALTTEYWTRLDLSKIKHHKELKEALLVSSPGGTPGSRGNPALKLKKVKLGLAKFTSLFGECDEFKLLDIYMPAVDYELELLYNLTQVEMLPLTATPSSTVPTTVSTDDDTGDDDLDEQPVQQFSQRQVAYDNYADCISAEKCAQLNRIVNGTCFCCSDRCCLLKTRMCDGVSNCRDRSDEAETCPTRRLHFATNYTDNKHNCLRHQYNLWDFARGVFDRAIMGNRANTSAYCLVNLMSQTNQSVKVFTYRVLTIVSMLGCIKFTIFCLITLIFVSCCHDLPSFSVKKRKNSLDDDSNGFNCGAAGDHEFDQYSLSASGSGAHQRSCCCKCNCLLCPFVFFSIFALLAAVSALASLGFYLLSMYHFKLNYLIYDPLFMPEYVTKAYQFNPWLFDLYALDLSFYSLLVACFFYVFALVAAVSISCRIQMSPAWRRRYTDSYEVLEMHDMMASGSVQAGRKGTTGKNTYKKLNQGGESKAMIGANSTSSDDKKKSSSKKKPLPIEMAKAVPESDEISLYDEAQTLTSPKTRLTAVDNSYE